MQCRTSEGHRNKGRAALWLAVQGCRRKPRPECESAPQGNDESSGVDGQEKLAGELHDVRTVNRHRWVRRAASGERVKRGQGTRHNDPVTSEEGMPAGGKASRPNSVRSQRIGPSDCLAKTQVCAKPHKAPYTH